MKKRLMLGCGAVALACLLVASAALAFVFHSVRRECPWSSAPALDEMTWTRLTASSASPHEVKLTVLTWNIQMLPALLDRFSSDLRKKQNERAPWIVDYLNAQDYDVICFQEVFDQNALAVLKEGLKGKYPYAVDPQYASPWRALGNGVLFVSRAPIRYVNHVTYPGLERVEWWTSKGCCLIEGVKDGFRFQMAGTHFPTGKQRIKDAALAAIHDRLLPLCKDRVPLIVLGDFNTRKGSSEYETLLKTLEVQDSSIDDLRPYTSDSINSWKSGKTGRGPALIDHVLLDAHGTATVFDRASIQRATHEYQGAPMDLSDHYGLVAEILLRP